MNSTLENQEKQPCMIIKKVILKNGTIKEYMYNQSKYNSKFYENNKQPIICACGGRYSKHSKFTHEQRSKTHHKYIESLNIE